MIKRIFRNAKSKYIVNQIEWFEGALIDQGRDYYPFGLADYCCYQPDAIKNELIRLRDCRKEWVNSLKRNDYQLYVKLYPDEGKRERELNQIIEETYKNAIISQRVCAEYAAKTVKKDIE